MESRVNSVMVILHQLNIEQSFRFPSVNRLFYFDVTLYSRKISFNIDFWSLDGSDSDASDYQPMIAGLIPDQCSEIFHAEKDL